MSVVERDRRRYLWRKNLSRYTVSRRPCVPREYKEHPTVLHSLSCHFLLIGVDPSEPMRQNAEKRPNVEVSRSALRSGIWNGDIDVYLNISRPWPHVVRRWHLSTHTGPRRIY